MSNQRENWQRDCQQYERSTDEKLRLKIRQNLAKIVECISYDMFFFSLTLYIFGCISGTKNPNNVKSWGKAVLSSDFRTKLLPISSPEIFVAISKKNARVCRKLVSNPTVNPPNWDESKKSFRLGPSPTKCNS